jgi:hypothetical protein
MFRSSKHLIDDEAVSEGFFRVDGALGDRRRAIGPRCPNLPAWSSLEILAKDQGQRQRP